MPVHDFNFSQSAKQQRLDKVDKSVVQLQETDEPTFLPGRGLDIGTANLVAGMKCEDESLFFRSQRNAFISLRDDDFTKSLLSKLKIRQFTHNKEIYVLGDAAFEIANFVDKNTRRPMKEGLISPTEIEALPVIAKLIGQVIGRPSVSEELIYLGIPANPIDQYMNVIYHKEICKEILKRLGYNPKPMDEGHAIVFAELAGDKYTGIGISCGAGMFNITVSYRSISCLSFSTSRAGDWIDENVARVTDSLATRIASVKESGIDLSDPNGREEEAIVIYYRSAISYALEKIKEEFAYNQDMPSFNDPVDIVCSGGTSLAGGFIDIFSDEFEKMDFPIEVKQIRLAEDPLNATAKGLLNAAQNAI